VKAEKRWSHEVLSCECLRPSLPLSGARKARCSLLSHRFLLDHIDLPEVFPKHFRNVSETFPKYFLSWDGYLFSQVTDSTNEGCWELRRKEARRQQCKRLFL
jgi:hypothetical protein